MIRSATSPERSPRYCDDSRAVLAFCIKRQTAASVERRIRRRAGDAVITKKRRAWLERTKVKWRIDLAVLAGGQRVNWIAKKKEETAGGFDFGNRESASAETRK